MPNLLLILLVFVIINFIISLIVLYKSTPCSCANPSSSSYADRANTPTPSKTSTYQSIGKRYQSTNLKDFKQLKIAIDDYPIKVQDAKELLANYNLLVESIIYYQNQYPELVNRLYDLCKYINDYIMNNMDNMNNILYFSDQINKIFNNLMKSLKDNTINKYLNQNEGRLRQYFKQN